MRKLLTFLVICGAVLTLFGLGTWQVQRLQWKQNIIDNLNAEYEKDPAKHVYNFEKLESLRNQENPILYGSVTGRFNRQDPIFLQPKTHDRKVGAHVIHPFTLNFGGTVFVNRGWINKEDIETFTLPSDDTQRQNIQGIFRKADWNRFTSGNSPAQNIWAKADIDEMAEHYKLSRIAPVMLYATKISSNQDLVLQDTKWYPRNKHLQYAIFWYGMIFVLLGLVAMAVKTNKKNR